MFPWTGRASVTVDLTCTFSGGGRLASHGDVDEEDGLAAFIADDRARSLGFSRAFVKRCKEAFTSCVFFYFPFRTEKN